MIDTLIRYKEKGSYSGMKENNPEILIEEILNHLEIPFEKGDLSELIDNAPDNKRTMDFIIPNKKNLGKELLNLETYPIQLSSYLKRKYSVCLLNF